MTTVDTPVGVGTWAEHRYDDAAALCAQVATRLQQSCSEAIAQRGKARLALAGGTTPMPVYRRLAGTPLPWPRIEVLPTDERCVPHDHPACNLRAMQQAFAAADGLDPIALTPPDGAVGRALAFAQAALAARPEPFDAVLLGMGVDTHVASLFPGAAGTADALAPGSADDVVRIDPEPLPPEAPFARISLTAGRLLRTRACHLVIAGEAKLRALHDAIASCDRLRHPVLAILHAPAIDVQVHWSP